MRDGTALRFPPPRIRAYGGRAWPGRSRPGPLPASGPRGHRLGRSQPAAYRLRTRVPPSPRPFGPSPDLPPAGYGMTRSAQVGAPTEGTPASFPDRTPASPVVRCLICGLTRIGCHGPSGSPACRFCRPQPERFHQVADDNNHAPTTTARRTAKAERAGCCCYAKLRWQSGPQPPHPAGCLPAAYPLRPEFCSAQGCRPTS